MTLSCQRGLCWVLGSQEDGLLMLSGRRAADASGEASPPCHKLDVPSLLVLLG